MPRSRENQSAAGNALAACAENEALADKSLREMAERNDLARHPEAFRRHERHKAVVQPVGHETAEIRR